MNFLLELLNLFSTISFNEGRVVAENEFRDKPIEDDSEDCKEEAELELKELLVLELLEVCKYWPNKFDELEFGVFERDWMAEELLELTFELILVPIFEIGK